MDISETLPPVNHLPEISPIDEHGGVFLNSNTTLPPDILIETTYSVKTNKTMPSVKNLTNTNLPETSSTTTTTKIIETTKQIENVTIKLEKITNSTESNTQEKEQEKTINKYTQISDKTPWIILSTVLISNC